MTQSAQELGRQQQWAEAVADGRVRGWLENGQVTMAVDSIDLVGTPLDVPLTLGPSAAFGDPYGTGRSAWIPISGRQQIAAVAAL